jgi:PAS domain S-box-containing protein
MTDAEKTREQLILELAELRQRVAELELRERRYRTIIETVPLAIAEIDREGVITFVNQATERLSGYTPEEFVGKVAWDGLKEDLERDRSRARFVQIMAEQPPLRSMELTRFKKGGERIELRADWNYLHDEKGAVSGLAVVLTDISQSKRAEESLKKSEAELQRVMSSISDGLWSATLSPTGETIHRLCSDGIARIAGYPPSYFLANEENWLIVIHPDDRERLKKAADRMARGESLHEEEEYRLIHANGTIRWVRDSVVASRHSDGCLRLDGVLSDITERKVAEEEAARSRAMLQATIDSIPFNCFAVGPDGRYMLQNLASQKDYGANIVGKRPEEACRPPHDLATWQANNRRAFAGERVEEELTLSFEGEVRHYYNVIVPIVDGQQSYGIVGVCIDITDRKNAEAALRRAHNELELRVQQRTAELTEANQELAIFRRFAEAASQGFAMADIEGRVTYANPAFRRILGIERPDDILGTHLSINYAAETRQWIQEEVFSALFRDGHWQGERIMVARDGARIQTWHNSFLIRDERGNPIRLAAGVTDITERKKAEESLRQSRDELQVIYDCVMDGLVVIDVETFKNLRVNPAMHSFLGYDEEEMKDVMPAQLHPSDMMPKIAEHFQAAVRGEVTRFEAMPFLCKDGSVVYADVVSSRISYNGRPCLINFFHDVTEGRRAKAALLREQRTLEHLLRSSDHERQLIAYEIHDGLAQYLAGALMQFDVYKHLKDTKSKDAAKAFEAGITMLRQSHSEARRLISGVRPPILDEAGIVAAISHLVNEQKRQDGRTIEFHSKVEFDRLVPILENAIYRIVQESLTNACQHSKSKRIAVGLVQQGDRLYVRVQDWGVGFDPQKTEEGRFGLEGIRERTRLLGGTANIESQPGKGTTINVELPVVLREEG